MTMRKTIILTIACMCLAVGAYAQRGSGRLSLGAPGIIGITDGIVNT